MLKIDEFVFPKKCKISSLIYIRDKLIEFTLVTEGGCLNTFNLVRHNKWVRTSLTFPDGETIDLLEE